ncbi:MAG: hypothetical protein ACRC4W_02785 [Treponemataceae bacterium]
MVSRSKEYETTWREKLIKDYGDGAEEELFCIPSTQGERYFKKVWLDAVSDKEIPVFRFSAKDDFTHQKDYKRSRQINAWFDEVLPILQDCKNPVVFGQDFARSGDLTVYWLMLKTE